MRRRSRSVVAGLALLASLSPLVAGAATGAAQAQAQAQESSSAEAAPAAPAVAPPTSTSTPLLGDFDGDGRSDQFWYGAAGTPDHVWYGQGTRAFSGRPVRVGGTYTPLIGDFTGDGRDDIVWYRPGSGADYLWRSTADRGFVGTALTIHGPFTPFVGDFDGDGRSDVFWYSASGDDRVWFGTGGGGSGFVSLEVTVARTYVPVVGNFDGKGGDDVLWYGPGTAPDYLWREASNRSFSGSPVTVAGNYTPAVGDFRGDGRDDIYWHRDGNDPRHDVIWSGGENGGFFGSEPAEDGISPPSVGDLDGNGASDLLWNEAGTADDRVAYGAAGGFTDKSISVGRTYFPQIADYNGDGRDDVFWYAPGATADPIWFGSAARAFASQMTAIDLALVPDAPLQEATWATQFNPYGYVAHAMGPTPADADSLGRQFGYTNTLEAFQANYDRGFRVLEVDWVRLADGTVLAAHDGTEARYGLPPGVTFAETTRNQLSGHYTVGGRPATASRPAVPANEFTPLFADDIPALLASHPDVHLILDTKYDHLEIVREFVQLTAGSPGMMNRLMPHVAGQSDLDAMRAMYPIRNYVLALYRTQAYNRFDDDEVVTFVRNNRTPAVMMWYRTRNPNLPLDSNMGQRRRYTATFVQRLRLAGALPYVHSIDETGWAQGFAAKGVGIYTNGPFPPFGAEGTEVIVPPIEGNQPLV